MTPRLLVLLVCAVVTPAGSRAQVTDTVVVGSHWDYPAASTPFRAEVVATGIQVPWGLAFLPDGSLLATDRATGRLCRIDVANGVKRQVEGVPATFTSRDAGLLDVVVHPRFGTNGRVYLSFAHGDSAASTLRVVRARLLRDSLRDLRALYTAPQPLRANTDHFGGRMLLVDHALYVTSGDRRVPRDSAQSLTSPLGKVLRLDADGAVPAGNPYNGKAPALPEIWTMGHRNPQGIARHPTTGAVWVNEHGPQGGDEVNVLARGANYGWPVVTFGEEYGGGRIGRGSTAPGMRGPAYHFTPSIAPSGLMFYTGKPFARWAGNLFMGALAQQHLNRLTMTGTRVTGEERLLEDRRWRVRVVTTGPDGLIYLGVDGGLIVRLRPLREPPRSNTESRAVTLETRQVLPGDGQRSAHVWLPARGQASPPWALREVVLAGVPAADTAAALGEFGQLFHLGADSGTALGALSSPVHARGRSADRAPRPTIVMVSGGNMPAYASAHLASRFASAGFVAVVMPGDPAQDGEPAAQGIDRSARQLRDAMATIANWPEVDGGRVVLAAWSSGELAALLAGAESPGIVALVSLDGAMGFRYGDELLRRRVGETWRLKKPYFRMEAGRRESVPRSDAILQWVCDAPTWRYVAPGVAHRHFSSLWGSSVSVTRETYQAIDEWQRVMTTFVRAIAANAVTAWGGPAGARLPFRRCEA